MLWFDMNTDHATDPLKIRVAAYYYNRAREWGKEVAISAKQPRGSPARSWTTNAKAARRWN
jgi:alpha-L-fucosidase